MLYYFDNVSYSPSEIFANIAAAGGLQNASQDFAIETLEVVRANALQKARDIEELTAKINNRLSSDTWTSVLQATATIGTTIPNPYTLAIGALAGVASQYTAKNSNQTRNERTAELEKQVSELSQYAELEKQAIERLTPTTTEGGGSTWILWAIAFLLLALIILR